MNMSPAGYKETGDESCQAADRFHTVGYMYMHASAIKIMPMCFKIKKKIIIKNKMA